MYLRSFLCEEAKIKQRTSLKKELFEVGEEAIWESRLTSFFNFTTLQKFSKIVNFSVHQQYVTT